MFETPLSIFTWQPRYQQIRRQSKYRKEY